MPNSNSAGDFYDYNKYYNGKLVYDKKSHSYSEDKESAFEKVMKEIILKEDFLMMIKDVVKQAIKEVEEEKLNEQLKAEFDIMIKRKDGTQV